MSSLLRRAALGALTSIAGSATVLAAQTPRPDPVGVWTMDTTKFAKRDAALSALELTVSRSGDTLIVVTDVQDTGRPPFQMRARYVPAAMVAAVASADPSRRASLFSWEGDTLVLHTIETRPQRTLDITERWAIDATGHTLSRLQTVIDGARISRQTLVFTRR